MASDSGSYDESVMARRYAIAQKLMEQGQAPVKSWTQGLANMANAGLGGWQMGALDAERKADKASEREDLYKSLGLPAPAATPEAPSPLSKILGLLSGGGGSAPDAAPAPPAAIPAPAPAAGPPPSAMAAAPVAAPVAPPAPVMAAAPPRAPVDEVPGMIRTNPDGTIAGNITSPTVPTPAGVKVAQALAPQPAVGPTDVSAAAKPPAVATGSGILAGVPDEKKSQIAMMLTSKNPDVKATGRALMNQALAASDTPKYEFKTAGDSLYRTNAKTGTAEPVRDVGRSVQPMTPEQRKTWNVPEGMSAGIDDNGKPVFSPPGTNINLNTAQSGTKAMQEKSVEDYQGAQAASREAVKRSGIWDQMEQASKGFTPGATAEVRLTAKRFLKDAGIIAGEDVPDAEVFKQMQQQIAIHAQPKGQGAVSNSERELFAKAIPNITMSPEALGRSIQISRDLDGYDRKVAQIYRDNAKANGGIPNSIDVNEAIEKLGSPLSVRDTNYLRKASEGGGAAVAQPAGDGWNDLGGGVRIREKR